MVFRVTPALMDATGHEEPVAEGQEGKAEEQDAKSNASDESGSGEVIIELDQSQIASPSDSEEEGQVQEEKKNTEISYNKTADSEYFDAVSDLDDLPGDEDESAAGKQVEAESQKETVEAGEGDDVTPKISSQTVSAGDVPALPQGPTDVHSDVLSMSEVSGEVKHKDSIGFSDTCSESANVASKDRLAASEHTSQSETDRSKQSPPPDDAATIQRSPEVETPVGECSQGDGSNVEGSITIQEVVSKSNVEGENGDKPGVTEATAAVKSAGDISAIADDVSDVSSEGEAPLSPVDESEKPSAEKLSQEAAHQAEVLAPLGAEPVSEPESGEDMGSDESTPPQSPGFNSPVAVTSTSRISLGSGDYADVRTRMSSRSPRKSDSAAISDSSSLQPIDRLSLEDTTIPPTFSASDNKLDLSASLDMENISDDENIGEVNDTDDTSGEIEDETETGNAKEAVTSSSNHTENEVQKPPSGEKAVGEGERVRHPIMIASLGDKQQVQTHFNEEQVELDYEDVDGEGDGDDGEVKADDDEDGKEVSWAL